MALVSNHDVAQMLREIGEHLAMKNIPFKPRAYEKAAGIVDSLEEEVAEIYETGGKKALEGGIDYLKGLGINVESLAHDIKWHTDKCTHCTACIPACPSGAMTVDRETWQVSFDRDRCIACELCIRICPFNALEIQF